MSSCGSCRFKCLWHLLVSRAERTGENSKVFIENRLETSVSKVFFFGYQAVFFYLDGSRLGSKIKV